MDDLIEALTIFRKYCNSTYPTHCEHDTLFIMDVRPDEVNEQDTIRLAELGFIIVDDGFASFHFGSA